MGSKIYCCCYSWLSCFLVSCCFWLSGSWVVTLLRSRTCSRESGAWKFRNLRRTSGSREFVSRFARFWTIAARGRFSFKNRGPFSTGSEDMKIVVLFKCVFKFSFGSFGKLSCTTFCSIPCPRIANSTLSWILFASFRTYRRQWSTARLRLLDQKISIKAMRCLTY